MILQNLQNDFKGSNWKREIDVRDFIQSNYEAYDGDESFLVGPTERTNHLWEVLSKMFEVERVACIHFFGNSYWIESVFMRRNEAFWMSWSSNCLSYLAPGMLVIWPGVVQMLSISTRWFQPVASCRDGDEAGE